MSLKCFNVREYMLCLKKNCTVTPEQISNSLKYVLLNVCSYTTIAKKNYQISKFCQCFWHYSLTF